MYARCVVSGCVVIHFFFTNLYTARKIQRLVAGEGKRKRIGRANICAWVGVGKRGRGSDGKNSTRIISRASDRNNTLPQPAASPRMEI